MAFPVPSRFSRLLLIPVAALALACDKGDGDSDSDGTDSTSDGSESDTSPGCGDGSGPSFAETVLPIIDATCVVACHEPGGAWPLNNLSVDPYGVMVNIPALQDNTRMYVEPCNADNSYMYMKLTAAPSSWDPANTTRRMPLDPMTCTSSNWSTAACEDGVILSGADIQTIKDWIDLGAEP